MKDPIDRRDLGDPGTMTTLTMIDIIDRRDLGYPGTVMIAEMVESNDRQDDRHHHSSGSRRSEYRDDLDEYLRMLAIFSL